MTRLRISVAGVEIRVDADQHQAAVDAAVRLLALALEHAPDGEDIEDTERPALGFTSSMDLDPGRHDLVLGEPMWEDDVTSRSRRHASTTRH